MPVQNNFIITSATSVGDQVTLTGTVNGTPVTVQCWLSALQKLSSIAAVQSYVSSLMLAAQPPAPQTVAIAGLVGSFTA